MSLVNKSYCMQPNFFGEIDGTGRFKCLGVRIAPTGCISSDIWLSFTSLQFLWKWPDIQLFIKDRVGITTTMGSALPCGHKKQLL